MAQLKSKRFLLAVVLGGAVFLAVFAIALAATVFQAARQVPSDLTFSSVVIADAKLGVFPTGDATGSQVAVLHFRGVALQPPLHPRVESQAVFIKNLTTGPTASIVNASFTLVEPCREILATVGGTGNAVKIGHMNAAIFDRSGHRLGDTCGRDVTMGPDQVVRASIHIELFAGAPTDVTYVFPAVFGAVGQMQQPQTAKDIKTIVDWITGLQYNNASLVQSYGAIKVHHTAGFANENGAYFRVSPYNANLAVAGLIRSPVSGKWAVAEGWINWYLSHINADGTIYDHWYSADGTGQDTCLTGINPPPCNHSDSEDSYAATFLGAVWTYYELGGNLSFLNTPGNKAKFETIAGAILALQQATDGLTWAKNTHHVKFLMNNSEVYWGLRSMAKLEAVVFGDQNMAQMYDAAAERVRNGILNVLLNAAPLYRVALFENGVFQDANLNQWYPGTVALAWPHLFGVTDGSSPEAQVQMAALDGSWDGDPNPDWTNHIVDPNGFLWPSIGHAALLARDSHRAESHAIFVKSLKFPIGPGDVGFSWPFMVDDGGWLLMTLSKLAEITVP